MTLINHDKLLHVHLRYTTGDCAYSWDKFEFPLCYKNKYNNEGLGYTVVLKCS